jgi:hypothetical protein
LFFKTHYATRGVLHFYSTVVVSQGRRIGSRLKVLFNKKDPKTNGSKRFPPDRVISGSEEDPGVDDGERDEGQDEGHGGDEDRQHLLGEGFRTCWMIGVANVEESAWGQSYDFSAMFTIFLRKNEHFLEN